MKMHKKTIKREFFVVGLISSLIIAVIFIALISVSVYFLSLESAQEKLKSANQRLTTYAGAVLESLVMTTRINALSPEVRGFEKGNLETEKNILALFATTSQANPNIKYCYSAYEDGFVFPFVAPWGSVIIVVMGVFVIVSLTMLYSSSKLKKENIIDALKNESI